LVVTGFTGESRRWALFGLGLVVATVLLRPGVAAASTPVPSLTPATTAALWRHEVLHRGGRGLADDSCRPSRVVFYDQTDWLRVATKLAQTPSPCAQYFISVPPLAAAKTVPRAGQAASIRALGPNFHALDEVSYSGWNRWVAAGNGSWFDAGVAARERMTTAGFDTGSGDTWALNELSSAVRNNTGAARANALEFLRGLASDGVEGVVFTAGVSQSTPDLTQYKVALQDWLQDTDFWTAAAGYVSDWAQENYGDLRDYAVAGTTPDQRRDAMTRYLANEPALANAGPDTAAAQAVLAQTYVPFGNAAWAWPSAYGWTAAPVEQMEDFVSGQVDADRSFAATTGAAIDRIGFAWSPRNTFDLTRSEFTAETAAILGRIAAAIQATAAPDPDPGSAACVPDWCTTTLDGAAFAAQWQEFSAWSPLQPAFVTAPVSATTGDPAGPLTVQLQTLGLPDSSPTPTTFTISSSSVTGEFATSAAGPWTPTLSLPLAPGSNTVSFFYLDSTASAPVLTATLADGTTAVQTETIAAAPPEPPADPAQSTTYGPSSVRSASPSRSPVLSA
jgi:hypothetical protein